MPVQQINPQFKRPMGCYLCDDDGRQVFEVLDVRQE